MYRKWMVALREARGWTARDAAQRTGASTRLIRMVEAGEITHPAIADRIARVYGMDIEQRNMIVHETHALHKLRAPTKKKGGISRYKLPPILRNDTTGGM